MKNEFLRNFISGEIPYLILAVIILDFLAGQIKELAQESIINKVRKKWNEKRKKNFEEARRIYPFEESLGYREGSMVIDKQSEYYEKLDEATSEEIKKEYNLTDKGWEGLESIFLVETIKLPKYKKKIKKIKKAMKDYPLFSKNQND
jgi:RecG-like helicase